MYSIDELLQLVKEEQADEIRLAAGSPPIFVNQGEPLAVEGPGLTVEDVEQMLLNLADTRNRRVLRDTGRVQFLYTFRKKTPFLVAAELKGEVLRLVVS